MLLKMSFAKVIFVILLSEQLWILDFLNETVSFWISVSGGQIWAFQFQLISKSSTLWPRLQIETELHLLMLVIQLLKLGR